MFFYLGIRNSECRNVVGVTCIGPCQHGSPACNDDCKRKDYTRGECSLSNEKYCCCVT